MPRKKKLTPQQAKATLIADGIDFRDDFDVLSSSAVSRIVEVAKAAGYRKSKNAPGSTARMFFQYLSRVKPVVRASGQLTPAERRGYQTRAQAAQTRENEPKSKRQLDKEIDDALSDPELTPKQVDALIDKHGVSRMKFWQEAGGGDRVPMSRSVALRIIGAL